MTLDYREIRTYIYVICRLGGPYSEKLTEVTVFTIRTDPKPVNNIYFFSKLSNGKKSRKKYSLKRYCDRGQR